MEAVQQDAVEVRETDELTPEYKKLQQVSDDLRNLLLYGAPGSAPGTETLRVWIPPSVRNVVTRAQETLDEVLEVMKDYFHMQARIDELETELDDRDARLTELEEQVHDLISK